MGRVEYFLIVLVLFCFVVFMFSDLETAIAGVAGEAVLKPLFTAFPTLLIGGVFAVFLFWMVKRND